MDGEDISCNEVNFDTGFDKEGSQDLSKDIEVKSSSVLVKLKYVFIVYSAAVDELLQEFQYLISSVSLPIAQNTITQILQELSCQVYKSVIEVLANALCKSNPIQVAIGDRGTLSTAWK